MRHGDEIRIGQTRLVFRDPLASRLKQHLANPGREVRIAPGDAHPRAALANQALRRASH